MTDENLNDLEKRVLTFLHLANSGNFLPPLHIIARVLGVSQIEAGTALTRLSEIGYVTMGKNDKTPNQAGYRAYIPDTSQEQQAVDNAPSVGGGGEATPSQGDTPQDTGQ